MFQSQSGSQPSATESLEIEVKFYVPDLAAVRSHLLAIGGRLQEERVYQRNVRFDTVDDVLLRRQALLRLRRDREVTLTFKGLPKSVGPSQARILEELEIKVDDFETATTIVNRLGFLAKQVYEKYRETFILGNVEVLLDELPFGDFVEIEGLASSPDGEAAIRSAAERLHLDWSKRITTNYLSLMAALKRHHNLAFNDLTFANFEGLSVSVADILT
jgi:adenylate cyclase class 2